MLATLWWYSASVWLPCPALASLVVTGRALSPALPDLTMNWWPDSRITGATSAAVLTGSDAVAELGAALRTMFGAVISPLAEAGQMKQPPLWAIASDSLADRLLWAGNAIGERERATALAEPLARAIGPRCPAPRYVDVHGRPSQPARFVRRSSCCLLYAAPHQSKCSSCPKRVPERQAAPAAGRSCGRMTGVAVLMARAQITPSCPIRHACLRAARRWIRGQLG